MEMKKQKKIIRWDDFSFGSEQHLRLFFLNRRQKKLHRKKRQKYIKMK